jgi:hypothetical protein
MPYPSPRETNLVRIVRSIQELWEGRSNAVGQFTCAESAASTVVAAMNCGPNSKIALTPRHANAAAELASGNMYISAVTVGAFTVAHTNAATANRTFDYAISG